MPRTFPAAQQFAARERDIGKRRTSRVIRVCGAPATGKSYLLSLLDAQLGLPTFSIDEERLSRLQPGQGWPTDSLAAWCSLEDAVDSYSPCAIETSGRSGNDPVLLQHRQVYTVVCTADDAVRKARLQQRVVSGYRLALGQADYVDRLLKMQRPAVKADLVWDSTADGEPMMAMQSIESWLVATG